MPRSARVRLPTLEDRIPLASSGLSISPFCLGMTGAPEVVLAAYDAGVNFFFLSADMHWPYYEHTRAGLRQLLSRGGGIRDRLVVAVASYVTQPEFCFKPFREVLEAVPGLERIDVVVAGGAYSGEILTRLGIYQSHRKARFCGSRGMGVTFHDRAAAALVASGALCDVAFVRFNPLHPGARRDVFPHLAGLDQRSLLFGFKSTIGVLDEREFASLGLGDDYWRPRKVDGYRFALSHPEVDGVLWAATEPRFVSELAEALAEGPLSEDELGAMITLAGSYEAHKAQAAE